MNKSLTHFFYTTKLANTIYYILAYINKQVNFLVMVIAVIA
jgi:hypothetical protein